MITRWNRHCAGAILVSLLAAGLTLITSTAQAAPIAPLDISTAAQLEISTAAPLHINVRVQATELEQPQDYFSTLLRMALEASKAPNEVIDLSFSPREQSQARWINLLMHDRSDFVIWTMASAERETLLRPIRIPLFKGLFSYRVLVIRRGEQPRFDRVKNLLQLKQLIAGQGTHWPDSMILRKNNFQLRTADSAESLYLMLRAKRFDYFPRGVSEAWFELQQRREPQLAIEQNLLLYYPAPMYFFVNKANEALALRIETGLQRLIDSGEFDRFFYQHARVLSALAELRKHPRTLLKITNPYLPEDSLVGQPDYWLEYPFNPSPMGSDLP
jgi:hypothetical protein